MAFGSLILGGAGLGYSMIAGRKAKKERSKARKQQQALYNKAMGYYDELAEKYKPTGTYGQSLFENLKTQKKLDVGASTQQFLRAGLGGTSFADTSNQYERTVGRKNRLTLEDFLTDKYAGVRREQAGVTQNYANAIMGAAPTSGDVSSAYSGVGQGLGLMLENLPDNLFGFLKKKAPTTVLQDTKQPGTYGSLGGINT